MNDEHLRHNPVIQRMLAEGKTPELLAAARRDPQLLAAFEADTGIPASYITDPTENPETSDDPDKIWICKTCRVVLDSYTLESDDTRTWLHTRPWRKYDHDPIAILVPRSEPISQACDFCGLETTINWVFTGQPTAIIGPGYERGYGKNWTACDTCTHYIDNEQGKELAARARRFNPSYKGLTPHETRDLDDALNKMWSKFFSKGVTKKWTGPPIKGVRLDPRHMLKYRAGLLKFWNHPDLYQNMSGHGQHLGQHLPAFTIDPDDTEHFSGRTKPGTPVPPHAFERFRQHIITGIKTTTSEQSGLFWLSKEFSQLASIAATEFTELLVTREQLPAPFGFAVYEQPIGEINRPDGTAGIRAFSWTLVPHGVWINIYYQADEADAYNDPTEIRAQNGYFLSPNPGIGFRFDTPVPQQNNQANAVNVVFATWLFLTQPGVAEQRPAPVDKKAARAYQRAHGHKQPDVTLVDLRRKPRRTTALTDQPSKRGPLEHRRYTRGHWKHQFFGPKRGQRKLIYISPYISGPEDAPLRAKPATVKVLR